MHPGGKAAGQVLWQPPPGDVGHAVDRQATGQEVFHQGAVEAGGGEEGLNQG